MKGKNYKVKQKKSESEKKKNMQKSRTKKKAQRALPKSIVGIFTKDALC